MKGFSALSQENKIKHLNGRLKALEQERTVYESALWEPTAKYFLPSRTDIYNVREKGEDFSKPVYDGTPIHALQLMVAGFHGYLVSRSSLWFRMKMKKKYLNDIKEVRQWLQDVTEYLYEVLDNSNFYSEAYKHFEDGGSIGTATMYCEEDIGTGRIFFDETHPREIYIAENQFGMIDTIFRTVPVRARNAVQKFGKDKLDKAFLDKAESHPYQEHDFIHAVFPRDDFNPTGMRAKEKRFASVWFRKASGADKKVLLEGGYDTLPYITWRYRVSSGESYGRSPAHDVIANVKGLNKLTKSLLGAADRAVNPPMNIPIDMKPSHTLLPGGKNYYKDPQAIIKPVEYGRYDIGVDREERLEQAILRHFHVDYFLMLTNAERQMTAYEVAKRESEKAIMLGATVGRFNSETLNQIIDRVFQIELNAGGLPEIPQVLLDYPGERIEIVYIGPLAQAQRRLFNVQGVETAIAMVLPIIQAQPSAADNIDWDKVIQIITRESGGPEEILNSLEEVGAIRSARQAVQQAEEMAQGGERFIQAAKTAAEAQKVAGGQIAMPGGNA